MFGLISEKKLREYVSGAQEYIRQNHIPPKREPVSGPREGGVRFSLDFYDPVAVDLVMDAQRSDRSPEELDALLERAVKLSFVEKVAELIREKGLRDPAVYKAAQIDRRLFSRMMSDPAYRPSMDTAVAIALALRLSVAEAEDLLERAGHKLSHSSKRDAVIEYFFRERIYDLTYINLVLERLRLRRIGR